MMTGPLVMMLIPALGTSKLRNAPSELLWTGMLCALQIYLSLLFSPRFNNRRYNKVAPGGVAGGGEVLGDLEPVDNCINSVLGQVRDWIV